MDCAAPRRASGGARRREHRVLEARALDQGKKNAARLGQTIVFVDESGLSERPHRCRTWAPRGHTPVLQYHFNWKTLSAMAGGDVVELLLSALSRRHQESASGRVPRTSDASSAG